jgi:hypothetical protein
MAQYHGKLEIKDRYGWVRVFRLDQHITHIGTDPNNDIVLEDWRAEEAPPIRLQIIFIDQGFKVVNLGTSRFDLNDAAAQTFAPRQSISVESGETVMIADFALTFRVGVIQGVMGSDATSQNIGLSLNLPATTIDPLYPVQGVITVRNLGTATGAQFKLAAEGLDASCYEIEPGPILYPDASREVELKLIHPHSHNFLAGDYRIRIRATAPDAYPDEASTISEIVHILPLYHHTTRLIPMDGRE